jgi:hypothetical protein
MNSVLLLLTAYNRLFHQPKQATTTITAMTIARTTGLFSTMAGSPPTILGLVYCLDFHTFGSLHPEPE